MERNRKLFRLVVDLYVNFYQQVTGYLEYKFTCSDKQAVMIDKFIVRLGRNTDENYLREYFEFAFNYWYDRGQGLDFAERLKGRIMIGWIIGEEAFERWENRKKYTFRYKIRFQLKKAVKIKLKKKNAWLKILLNLQEIEEKEKEKFHNTTKGFLWCYSNTILYNHKSTLCSTCINSLKCKETLENEHGNVFKIRGY